MSAPNSKAFGELLDATIDVARGCDCVPPQFRSPLEERIQTARAAVLSYVEGLEEDKVRLDWMEANVAFGVMRQGLVQVVHHIRGGWSAYVGGVDSDIEFNAPALREVIDAAAVESGEGKK